MAHLLKDSLYAPILSLYQTLKEQLSTAETDHYAIFLLSVKGQLKLFLLLWFFSVTNVWRYYFWSFCVYSGFCNGLLLAFCVLLSGAAGCWDFICFQLPQALLFIPAYCLAIYHCNTLHRQLSGKWDPPSGEPSGNDRAARYAKLGKSIGKKQLAFRQLPLFLLDGCLLLAGCLLEGYCNLPLLRLLLTH